MNRNDMLHELIMDGVDINLVLRIDMFSERYDYVLHVLEEWYSASLHKKQLIKDLEELIYDIQNVEI